MKFKFGDWLRKDEVSTSTNCIAGFQRPLFTDLIRRKWPWLGVWGEEDPFFTKKKGKLNEDKKLKNNVIKIDLPNVQQDDGYSCGAAIVQSICAYFGVGPEYQDDYVKKLKTDKDDGTNPNDIIEFFSKHGLIAKLLKNMDVKDLHYFIDKCGPVIVMLQAYGDKSSHDKSGSGHYVAAIGYDKNNIYFEDPGRSYAGVRAYLPNAEFEKRWHDIGKDDKRYHHAGIVVWKAAAVSKPTRFARRLK